jgi:hypothetical protein
VTDSIHSTVYGATQGARSNPSIIASNCGRPDINGKSWKCKCPIWRRHSLSVSYGHKLAILIHCWYCESCGLNDGYTEQRAALVQVGLLEADAHDGERFNSEEYDAERRARLLSYGSACGPYPQGRGGGIFDGEGPWRVCRASGGLGVNSTIGAFGSNVDHGLSFTAGLHSSERH